MTTNEVHPPEPSCGDIAGIAESVNHIIDGLPLEATTEAIACLIDVQGVLDLTRGSTAGPLAETAQTLETAESSLEKAGGSASIRLWQDDSAQTIQAGVI
ncbi:MAG TPA: hypothetical protein VMR45_02905 [Patescibacteria group bacterium]|nr:hypothetical protein [Patescibacteria group bacterium]